MRRPQQHLLIVTVAVLLVRCGRTETSADGLPQGEFPARFTDAVCDNIQPCCASAGFAYGPGGCRQVVADLASFLDSSGSYDPIAAQQCVDGVAAATRKCSGLVQFVEPGEQQCERVFVGSSKQNEECNGSRDCASLPGARVYCGLPANVKSGHPVCTLRVRGRHGDACDQSCPSNLAYDQCGVGPSDKVTCYGDDGLYCAADGTCAPLAPIGGNCTMHGCVLGAACDNGTCVTQSSGSPCLGHEDCLARMYCSTDGVCTEQKQYGASCASSEQCLSGACYQDHICHAGLEVGPHLCSGQPLKPPGTGGG